MAEPIRVPDFLPPQTLAMEQAVLGAALISKTACYTVIEQLVRNDFYLPAHRKIFDTIYGLVRNGILPDVLSLPEELRRTGKLDECGGFEYVDSLVESVPTATHIDFYCQFVSESGCLRGIIDACGEITETAKTRETKATELADYGARIFNELASLRALDGVKWGESDPGFKNARMRATGEIERKPGVPTGVKLLDWMTNGLQGGDLCLLAGYPGVGKTAWAGDIAIHAAKCGYPVDFVSLEMTEDQVRDRMLHQRARVNMKRSMSRRLNDDELHRLEIAAQWMERLPIGICERRDLNMGQLRSELRKRARDQGKDGLIIIDYLQRIKVTGKENRNQELGSIARDLKSLAGEVGRPVLCLSSLNRPLKGQENANPTKSSIRDSGEVEYESDCIFFMHRNLKPAEDVSPDDVDDTQSVDANLIVDKQRKGPTGVVKMQFWESYTTFVPPETNHGNYEADPRYS